MDNTTIAEVMQEIGELLEIKGENPFKIRAYQRASETIKHLETEVGILLERGELDEIPGIGSGIAEKIMEILTTGKCKYLEDLKKEIPEGLRKILEVPTVGPRTAKLVFESLGIKSIEELKKAAENNSLRSLRGLSEKTEENIIKGIEQMYARGQRLLLFEAYGIAREIVDSLRSQSFVYQVDMAGSMRRMKETIGDIDILSASKEPEKVMDYFCNLPIVEEVLARGQTKSSILTRQKKQVDLRVVKPEEYGSAIQYFTGSKEHSIKLRGIAHSRGLKINEYGIFETKGNKRIGGEKEEDIYKKLGLPLIPPVLREDRGEIEAAQENRLPHLVEQKDILGDLHVHSNWSDGWENIESIVKYAKKIGYKYIVISDHTGSLKIANALSPERLIEQMKFINKLNEKIDGITILKGAEFNIDSEGKLDFDEKIASAVDVGIGALHWGFGQTKEKITSRMIKAMENKNIDIIAHPTGRIMGPRGRGAYQCDLEAVFKKAKETGTSLELNSFPDRLDLNDIHLKEAKNYGIKIAMGTDAHNTKHLEYMMFGIATAQRGWLTKEDILNTYSSKELLKSLKS